MLTNAIRDLFANTTLVFLKAHNEHPRTSLSFEIIELRIVNHVALRTDYQPSQ